MEVLSVMRHNCGSIVQLKLIYWLIKYNLQGRTALEKKANINTNAKRLVSRARGAEG